MLAPKGPTFNGRPTFANPIYLKKAQSEKPCLYEILLGQSDPANRLVPDREETLTLERENRSTLNKDLIVQLILFIVDSGCTKHMTGNLTLLCNFVKKYLIQQFCHNKMMALLFGPLYDEFFNAGTSSVNNSSSPADNSKQQDTPPASNNQSSTEPSTPTNVNAEENNDNKAEDAQF
ncbi:hypothetical protein Tco_0169204 [Tanacetum coccineum]